jgi:CNT family concentrative nucleoside transporter
MWWWSAAALAADGGNFLPGETTLGMRATSFIGVAVLIGLAWALSVHRDRVDWRPVIWGVVLQLALGAIVLSDSASYFFFTVVDGGVNRLLGFAGDGAAFVFQSVQPHLIKGPDGTETFYVGTGSGISPPVKTFAFWILPTIVFFSSLMSLLYYLGVMQGLVRAIAWVMVRTLGTSGAESLSAAGNIFVGQTEAPLLIRPFVAKMTRSELMAVMTGGFATVAGGVLGAYVSFLQHVPNIAGHLVIASIMSAPAALAVAKVMVPETETPATRGEVHIPEVPKDQQPKNAIEAAARGASDGMSLAINVAAMLIAIVGLVSMANWAIGWVPVTFCADGTVAGGYGCVGGLEGQPLDLSRVLGWVFFPIAFVMGIPLGECMVVGRLLGEKIVLTELLAYIHLGELIGGKEAVMSQRSAIITSYALCGFANFASIGIQLGGIGGMAPERMGDLAELGLRAMIGGVIAACMTGAVVGVWL